MGLKYDMNLHSRKNPAGLPGWIVRFFTTTKQPGPLVSLFLAGYAGEEVEFL